MPQFTARVAAIRSTPSRADDVKTVTRLVLEMHDVSVDPLIEFLGDDVRVNVAAAPVALTPIEEAIADADVEPEDQVENGHVEVASAGRRRRGTRSSEHA